MISPLILQTILNMEKIDLSNGKYVISRHAKKSANSFTHISLYITKKNERFTVFVLPLEENKTMIEPLLFSLPY